MRRILLFVALLVVFVLWTFPHHEVVERLVTRRLAGAEVDVVLGRVSPRLWPLGYRIDDVVLRHGQYGMSLDEFGLGLGLLGPTDFRAQACGGSLEGRFAGGADDRRPHLLLRFSEIDPSRCIDLGSILLSGSFEGVVELAGLGRGQASSVVGRAVRAGSVVVAARSGNVSGHLPRAGAGGDPVAAQGRPIGSWEFARADLRARIDDGDVIVENAIAEAEGVRWEVPAARVARASGARPRVTGELRARGIDDSPRAKAVLGLLPRATEADDGWRRYRVSGTLDSPKIVGLK